jgi:hypothetical protein
MIKLNFYFPCQEHLRGYRTHRTLADGHTLRAQEQASDSRQLSKYVLQCGNPERHNEFRPSLKPSSHEAKY